MAGTYAQLLYMEKLTLIASPICFPNSLQTSSQSSYIIFLHLNFPHSDLRIILISWELIECTLIKREQSRTIQLSQNWRNILIHQGQHWRQVTDNSAKHIWNSLLRRLKCKTSEIVSLQKSLRVVDSTRNGGWVYTREGVDGPCVTAYLYNIWVFGCEYRNIRLDLLDHDRGYKE